LLSGLLDEWPQIEAWLELPDAEWLADPSTHCFKNALNTGREYDSRLELTAYRLQWVTGIPDRMRMAAPEKPSVGRYNNEGQPVLYTSLDATGAFFEMQAGGPSEYHRLWLQEYRIPVTGMRILDARPAATENDIVDLAFDYCETTERVHPYYGSRRIASLVRALGFDGILVPGVRGGRECRYTNFVVFNLGQHRGFDWQIGEPVPYKPE
jgi:RES domain-containing protein